MIKMREDIMNSEIPTIWFEIENEFESNLIIGGFYREWSNAGNKSQERQLKAMMNFTNQIELANKCEKNIVILGDMNLCSTQWDHPKFTNRYLSEQLRGSLAQNGMKNADLGYTYLADRLSEDGNTIQSSIDHIYYSRKIEERFNTS